MLLTPTFPSTVFRWRLPPTASASPKPRLFSATFQLQETTPGWWCDLRAIATSWWSTGLWSWTWTSEFACGHWRNSWRTSRCESYSTRGAVKVSNRTSTDRIYHGGIQFALCPVLEALFLIRSTGQEDTWYCRAVKWNLSTSLCQRYWYKVFKFLARV